MNEYIFSIKPADNFLSYSSRKRFFTRKGKTLKINTSAIESLISENYKREKVVSIFETDQKYRFFKANYALYASLASFTVLLFVLNIFINPANAKINRSQTKYPVFSSKPLTLGEMSSEFISQDSRAVALDQVFEKFNCPFTGLGKVFVEEADKNNIPYWLVPAVSFQESSCGKRTPKKDGEETYNAYGWGVWKDHVKDFDNWAHGIKVVSEYMGETFYSKGVTDPCEIMKIYTPPSNGGWCDGVKYYQNLIINYQS